MARKKKKTSDKYAGQFPEPLIGQESGQHGKHFAATCKAVTIVATAIALPMVGPDAAEDIGTKTYLAFRKRLEKQADFLRLQRILTYVWEKSRKLSLKFLEKENRLRRTKNDFEDCGLQCLEHQADSQLEFEELKNLVITIIAGLPDELQETFYMSRELRLKQKEIAERTKVTQSTVSLRLSHALEVIAAGIAPHVVHSGYPLPPLLAAYLPALSPASDQRNQ